MPKLKKAHEKEGDGRGHKAAKPAHAGVYRFKIVHGKMPSRRFIVAEHKAANPLSSLARALRITK
jgi:hypothetical protein